MFCFVSLRMLASLWGQNLVRGRSQTAGLPFSFCSPSSSSDVGPTSQESFLWSQLDFKVVCLTVLYKHLTKIFFYFIIFFIYLLQGFFLSEPFGLTVILGKDGQSLLRISNLLVPLSHLSDSVFHNSLYHFKTLFWRQNPKLLKQIVLAAILILECKEVNGSICFYRT